MLRLSLVLLAVFTWNVNANADTKTEPKNEHLILKLEKQELEKKLFGFIVYDEIASVESIEIIPFEEDVVLDFNTKDFLPANFIATTGMFKLDWNKIEIYEIEEEADLGINPKDYLPEDFNPYK